MIILWVSAVNASEFKKSNVKILINSSKYRIATGSKVSDSTKNNLKSVNLNVELALTPQEQEKGLMFRKSLSAGNGMLFVFSEEWPRQFWMKNTLIPLSIAFIDSKKTIFQISDLKPVKTLVQTNYDRAESVKPAKYVLEVPQGWFSANKITEGSQLVWSEETKFTTK